MSCKMDIKIFKVRAVLFKKMENYQKASQKFTLHLELHFKKVCLKSTKKSQIFCTNSDFFPFCLLTTLLESLVKSLLQIERGYF